MKIRGITGGIGSGKSVVLNIMKDDYNAYILEADSLAHRLMEPGQAAYNKILEAFGEDILAEDRSIDRAVLGKIVMQDKDKLDTLNSCVHPTVKEYILGDIEDKREKGTDLYVIEAALLIQDGYKSICDELWYVYANRELRISRLIAGRGFTREKAESFMNNQPDEKFFTDNVDKIIDNNGDIDKTKSSVASVLS